MDVVYTYSHLGGEEILLVRYPELNTEIANVVSNAGNPGRNKVSEEKTMRGRRLYAPKDMNRLFDEGFKALGWNELRDYYDIEIPGYPYRVKRAFKQCDFYKEPVLVEVQFGKYAFMFYDLAKFQYFFNKGLIRLGVEIVPCHFLHKQMSTGTSYGEQLIYDLERLSKNFPSVPVKIILIDMPIDTDDYSRESREEVRRAYEEVRSLLGRWSASQSARD